ncbi:amidase [Stappia sp. F7233]|uniref:Amidase n=1 Tax=Stappia albiluteola TaxID=2758565 RepID=A0A839AH58_9HYPH|nr:amidase [Stappia albiluteola]MBA5779033.1 amidase [Stappia albiluteola]
MELTSLSALELSQGIRERRLSCREVMQAYLSRIAGFNPKINAIVSLRDEDRLLAEADERDRELAAGMYRGWLHGIPQAVKDLAATKDIVTTFGSPILKDFLPPEDAIHVERLRSAGAILIGKTNTPEFGLGSHTFNPVFGPTRNPWDSAKSAGGSSGGAAAALVARLLPVADGSDMMGSLRNPAAYNNVIGLRPSYGRVPSGPSPEVFFDGMATDGPMGRSVADVAMLLSTQAGYDPRAPQSFEGDGSEFAGPLAADMSGKRIGWLGDLGGHIPFEPGVLDLCGNALKVFEDLGCTVELASTGFDMERVWTSWLTLRHWRVLARLAPLYNDPAKRALLKPEAIWEVEGGLALSLADIQAASEVRSQWHRAVLRVFASYDYLILPAAQLFPFDVDLHWPKEIGGKTMDTYHRWMEVVVPASLLGLPVLAVPAGFSDNGLPMGFQIIGRPRADLDVLKLGHAYEQATDWLGRTPPGF